MQVLAGFGEKFQTIAFSHSELDITDFEKVKKTILEQKPDMVINAVALMVDECEADPQKAMAINAEGPKAIAEACKEINAGFIQISTDYVFDGEKREGYSENDEVNPIDVYGESKLKAETYLQEVGGKNFIIRTSLLFGPNENNYVAKLVKAQRAGKEIFGATDQAASPTYAMDLAESIVKQFILEEREPAIYHLTNSESCTRYELAQEVFKILKKDLEVKAITLSEIPRPARRPHYTILKNTKLEPLRSFREALKVYLQLNFSK